ncbi:MAG: hypothetical protein ACR2F6_08125 [Mycobacteriales bacterium]
MSGRSEIALSPGGVVLAYRASDQPDPGSPIAVGLIGPRPVRAAVAGEPYLFVLLAARLAWSGVHLTVVTHRRSVWEPALKWIESDRLALGTDAAGWPGPSTPVPRALVVDIPEPPPVRGLDLGPWTSVVHVSADLPGRPDWWQAADVLVIGAPGYGAAVQAVRPDRGDIDAGAVDRVAAPQLAIIGATVEIGSLMPTYAEAELAQEVRRAARA